MDTSNRQPPSPEQQSLDLADTLAQVNASLNNLVTFLADRAKTQSSLSPDACLRLMYCLARLSRTLFIAQMTERRRCDRG